MNATTARAQLTSHPGDASRAADFPIPSPSKAPVTGAIRSFALPGPAGRLEAVLNEGRPDALFVALVCHPHPVFGGNLHNKVVYSAMKALNDPGWGLGWPVLRFNFRGAGLSEGEHDGQAEVDDVSAATDWLEREFDRPVVVAGFSFGAAMALRACYNRSQKAGHLQETRPVRALIALGLPLDVDGPSYRYSFLQSLAIPKLLLNGDCDPFAPAEHLTQIVASAAKPKQLVLLHGADHFFNGQLEPMQKAITNWLKEQLQ
jgi:alpha/beta superfamily hydrolase